jgi:hypothetical protein
VSCWLMHFSSPFFSLAFRFDRGAPFHAKHVPVVRAWTAKNGAASPAGLDAAALWTRPG